MKKILFSAVLLIFAIPAYAQDAQRTMPSMEHLMMSRELENDKSVQAINCGLFTEVDAKKPDADAMRRAQKENSRVKLLLYQASKTKDQTFKAKYSCASGEGKEVVNYLFVKDGKARFIEDLTRDGSGGYRINSLTCKDLQIGYLEKGRGKISYEFKPFKDEKYGDKIIVLQCKTADKNFLF